MCLEHKQYWQCCLTIGSKYIDPCPNADRGVRCKKDERVHPLEGYCPECCMSRDEYGDDVVTRPMCSRNDSYDRPWNLDYEVPLTSAAAYQKRRAASPSAQTERGRRSRRTSSPSPERCSPREYSYRYSDRSESPPPAVPDAPRVQMSWPASPEMSYDEIDDEYYHHHHHQPPPLKHQYPPKSKPGSKHKKSHQHRRREQQYIEDRYIERFLAPSTKATHRGQLTSTSSSSLSTLPSKTLRQLQNLGGLSSANIYVVSSPRDVQYLQQQGILPFRSVPQRLVR